MRSFIARGYDVITKFQQALTEALFSEDEDNEFHPIKLDIIQGNLAFTFVATNQSMTTDDFLNNNPELASAVSWHGGEYNFSNMYIFFSELQDQRYIDYIYHLLELIRVLCTNNPKDFSKYVKNDLNFEAGIIMKLATSET